MFCYQCEQTQNCTACTDKGVCGKTPEVAALQDLLVHVCKGISLFALELEKRGRRDDRIDHFVTDSLFTTVTNVNFDEKRMQEMLLEAKEVRDYAKGLYEKTCADKGIDAEELACPTGWEPPETIKELVEQGERCASIQKRIDKVGADLAGLEELLIYGIKGNAAYSAHARILGKENPDVYRFMHKAMAATLSKEPAVDELFGLNMECGAAALKVLALLDDANTSAYGHPVPTPVSRGHVKGKAILVSGHDLKDLEELLKQTEGKGINIYTHGEMLPAHGYPELKKYKHLVGHYGGAWQKQRLEFDAFPGAILMTTNCIQQPKPTYKDRIFTCGLVAWPDVTHISDTNFSKVIESALAAEGFTDDVEGKTHIAGFGHNAVLGVADTVVGAVKSGDIGRFMLVGGCDGSEGSRSYYTDVVRKAPDNWVVLTLGCGKFRVIDEDLGDIGGIPRVLDMGQCNDAFSAIKVAGALADVFETDVNGLPLSIVLSWFEQKAVCVLLALLHLGVKDIRIGPRLPAFVSPTVLNVLVEKFNIMPVGDPDADLKAMAAE